MKSLNDATTIFKKALDDLQDLSLEMTDTGLEAKINFNSIRDDFEINVFFKDQMDHISLSIEDAINLRDYFIKLGLGENDDKT